jgi:hypothetical protein
MLGEDCGHRGAPCRDARSPPPDGIPAAAVTGTTDTDPARAAGPWPTVTGHGRHGADAYDGAKRIAVTHATLHAGDT